MPIRAYIREVIMEWGGLFPEDAERDEGERGAYPGINLGTLNSLSLKHLVKAKYELGSIAMPHTCIRWSITDEGRNALVGGSSK